MNYNNNISKDKLSDFIETIHFILMNKDVLKDDFVLSPIIDKLENIYESLEDRAKLIGLIKRSDYADTEIDK